MPGKHVRHFRTFLHFLSHYWGSLLSAIVILAVLNLTVGLAVATQKETLLAEQETIRLEEISLLNYQLNEIVSQTRELANIVVNSDEMREYLDAPSPETLEGMEDLFYRISLNEESFLKIKFVDTQGMEIAAVFNEEGTPVILGNEELKDVSQTYYFLETESLQAGNFYLSPLEIQNFNGEPLVPYRPILRMVLPAFDENQTRMGILVVNIDAYDLLLFFNRSIGVAFSYTEFGLLSGGMLYQFRFDEEIGEYLLGFVGINPDDYSGRNLILTEPSLDPDLEEKLQRDTPFVQIFSLSDPEVLFAARGGFLMNHPLFLVSANLGVLVLFVLGVTYVDRRKNDRTLLQGMMGLADRHENAIILGDHGGKVIYVNPAYERMFGFTLAEMKGRYQDEFLDNVRDERFERVGKDTDRFADFVWDRTKSGIDLLSFFELKALRHASKSIQFMIGEYAPPSPLVTRMVDEKPGEEPFVRLALLARPLLDLPIRKNASTLLLFNISDLVNNRFFDYQKYSRFFLYEQLLPAFGRDSRLLVFSRGYFLLAGDLGDSETLEQRGETAMRILERSLMPLAGDHYRRFIVSAEICREDGQKYSDLLRNVFFADAALAERKTERFCVFSPNLVSMIHREKIIESQLENAFSEDQFHMNYQIQKSMGGETLTGTEALLRWENPVLGNVPPDEFIHKIENTPFVTRFTRMVLEKVIRDLSPFQDRFPEDFHIAVNLVAYDFRNQKRMGEIVKLIEDSPIPTRRFCFEITEDDYLENPKVANEIIHFLHTKSILVAIDDFGKGYSSLGALKNLKVDKVKIDRMFLKDYPEKDDGTIFRTLVLLAKGLGLIVLAEGVETENQARLAGSLGVDKFQGFLLSKPLSRDAFIAAFFPDR